MTTLAGGFLVTNYHDAGRKDFKKYPGPRHKTRDHSHHPAVDDWHG